MALTTRSYDITRVTRVTVDHMLSKNDVIIILEHLQGKGVDSILQLYVRGTMPSNVDTQVAVVWFSDASQRTDSRGSV